MDEISFAQGVKFIGALEAEGLTPAHAESVASNPHTAEDIVALLEGKATLCFNELPTASPKSNTTCLAQAKAIMQQNYHDPAKWASKCKFRLSKAHKEIFSTVPTDESVLWHYSQQSLLIPILPLSIMQLHTRHNALFFSKDDPWFATELFANEKPEAGWMLFSIDIISNSTSKTFAQQEAMLSEGESIATAAQLCQALICHAVLIGERLMSTIYARTNSIDSSGRRVNLGRFGEDGLGVGHWRSSASSDVGLSSSRKL